VVLKKSNELLQNYPLLAGSRDVVDLYSEVLEDLREEFGNLTIAQYETQIILQVREWSGKKRNLLQMASHSTGAPNAEQQQPEKRMRNENNSSVVQEQQERQNPTAAAATRPPVCQVRSMSTLERESTHRRSGTTGRSFSTFASGTRTRQAES
jgi:hypothetical protein